MMSRLPGVVHTSARRFGALGARAAAHAHAGSGARPFVSPRALRLAATDRALRAGADAVAERRRAAGGHARAVVSADARPITPPGAVARAGAREFGRASRLAGARPHRRGARSTAVALARSADRRRARVRIGAGAIRRCAVRRRIAGGAGVDRRVGIFDWSGVDRGVHIRGAGVQGCAVARLVATTILLASLSASAPARTDARDRLAGHASLGVGRGGGASARHHDHCGETDERCAHGAQRTLGAPGRQRPGHGARGVQP